MVCSPWRIRVWSSQSRIRIASLMDVPLSRIKYTCFIMAGRSEFCQRLLFNSPQPVPLSDTAMRGRFIIQSQSLHHGCFLLEAEEPQGNTETDQAIHQQAHDIREDIHKAFSEKH